MSDMQEQDGMISEQALDEAIRHDREKSPAPVLGGAAKAAILARMAQPAEPGIAERLRAGFASLAGPRLWPAMAAAGVAGIVAGLTLAGPLYATNPGGTLLSPEEEFIAYLGGDALATFLEEEDV